MLDLRIEEEDRLTDEIASLRQVIIRVEPSVMVDGRFEQMFTTPITVLRIARQLLEEKEQ